MFNLFNRSRFLRRNCALAAAVEPLERRQLLTDVYSSYFEDINHDGIYQSTEPSMARTAYIDVNNNGSLDDGEPTPQLDMFNRPYLYTGDASVVTVRATPELPDGWSPSTPQSYTFATTSSRRSLSFGGYDAARPIPTGGVDVFVFIDENANSIQDPGEDKGDNPTINRVVLFPVNSSTYGSFSPELTTDANGIAHFRNIRPGTYRLRVLTGGRQTTPPYEEPYWITIGDNIESATVGLAPYSAVSDIWGNVFMDNNENGVKNSDDEYLSGITVYIDANDNHVRDPDEHFTTTSAGDFHFYSAPAGTYHIRLDLPAGWHQTLPADDAFITVTVVGGQFNPYIHFAALDHEVIPTVTSSRFVTFTTRSVAPYIEMTFSKDIGDTLENEDVILHNLTTGEDFSATVSYDQATKTGKIDVRPGRLTDGNYVATLAAGSVEDLRHNKLAADYTHAFFILKGDLNRDRAVTINDFITMASNFNRATGGSTGPFNYYNGDLNEDGIVSVSDFIDLSAALGKTLPAPQPAAMATTSTPMAAASTSASLLTIKKTKQRHHHHSAKTLLS